MFRILLAIFLVTSAPALAESAKAMRPVARDAAMNDTRWNHQSDHVLWNRAALSALKSHGKPLAETVPRDITPWCPAYAHANSANRRAFWVGFLSALAKHESTYKPNAVGGGGRWFGLLQIAPSTARSYGCHARTGAALKDGSANLSCGIRIMAVTVPRDGVIATRDKKWRGVSADWGPMRSKSKRDEMAGWLRKQPYCLTNSSLRPRLRAVPGLLSETTD